MTNRARFRGMLLSLAAAGWAGCASPSARLERAHLSQALEERAGATLRPEGSLANLWPPTVDVSDGIAPGEAVAIALWNNPKFQESLSLLGIERAKLAQAGQLANPNFSILFPVGPKQLEFAATFPLEALWLRTHRVGIARLDAERVSQDLVQGGLDLARDTRLALADYQLAGEKARRGHEGMALQQRIAEIAEARQRAGEGTDLESAAARAEASRVREDARRFDQESALAEGRLLFLLGLIESGTHLAFEPIPQPRKVRASLESLIERALAARPDLRAAELAVEAAAKMASLAKVEWLALSGILDAKNTPATAGRARARGGARRGRAASPRGIAARGRSATRTHATERNSMNRTLPLCHGLALAVAILFGAGCKPQKAPAAKAAPPAKVITEDSLSSVVLTPQAAQRLGIATVEVVSKKMARDRTVGGDLLLPLGRPGETNASSGRSIYSLLPSMTPAELVRVAELQIEADGKVAAAEIDLTAAKVTADRAQNLVANKAGPQRGVDDARALVHLAEAGLQTARERRALLGAPLFDAVKRDLLWVRVPVYAGDLEQIDRQAPVRVQMLGSSTNKISRFARPVDVPFSPASAPATVDLFYELDNKDGSLRPGLRVTVAIPMHGEAESLVVPKSAILHDIHGGEWVYENTAAHTFVRRRVEVRFSGESGAVLARGPEAGTKVVTDGAAELFGTEFGIGK